MYCPASAPHVFPLVSRLVLSGFLSPEVCIGGHCFVLVL
jgi:hypothetical protein